MGKPPPEIEARDLSPDQFRRLVAHRGRQILEEEIPPLITEQERREIEQRIFEKVHQRRNFLPAHFLADGANRARAVCRIVTRDSLGTGFLIARGVLMTNNHVLESASAASGSIAEFGFEERGVRIAAAIQPDRLFITNVDLDFTIVAVDDSRIGDIAPIPILRSPATITRGELVNIIQHPDGRPKEVALQENDVVRVLDKVIEYRTDTEAGASGSPVFNNEWNLVALHHSGVEEPGGSALNEGVRMSAIAAHLISRNLHRGLVLDSIPGEGAPLPNTSPYLGFFDSLGVAESGSFEVEVPDIQGSVQFADVGFWNIEHFNNQVSDQRIGDVASVVGRLAMDVMGLTEVESGALDRLKQALLGQGLSFDFEVLNVDGTQDLAVLYDRETTQLSLRRDLAERYSEQLAARTPAGRSAFPRPPLFAQCVISGDRGLGEARFLLLLVHLKAFGDAQSTARRRLAAKMLAEIVNDLRERERLPVILGGDFNEQLTTDVLSPLTGSPDTVALTADDAVSGAISFVGTSHRSLIDHIIVSGDVSLGEISGDDAAIVRLDRSVRDFSDRVSDHVPIVFRIVYRERAVAVEPIVRPVQPVLPPVQPPVQPVPMDQGMRIPLPPETRSIRVSFEGGESLSVPPVQVSYRKERRRKGGETPPQPPMKPVVNV
ncbi:MAG TPA: trypsin-like peptidase domain-containing protein [Thermoanaerobaculia bacterium]